MSRLFDHFRNELSGPKPAVEYWIARRLGLSLSWDGGITSTEERRERIRRAILDRSLQSVVSGKRPGHATETWAETFERVYGEALQR